MLLTDKEYLLEKFPGKGGWTYAALPEIKPNGDMPFGLVKVRGSIDDYEINSYHLMPMGNGNLFLPVKAEIRKKIKKQEGDYVHITLYRDESEFKIPEEILQCLKLEPEAEEKFMNYKKGEQKKFIDWIYAAKKEETKANRIAKMLQMLDKGEML